MRKRKARQWLVIMGIMGGIITFLCGLIGCVFTDSMWKYLCMAALIAGFVLFFIWGGEQAILLLLGNEREGYLKEDLREATRNRLMKAAGSFEQLALTFRGFLRPKEELDERDMSRVFEHLSEHLCSSCERCRDCWENHFTDSYSAAVTILEAAKQQGRVDASDIPGYFAKGCICLNEFMKEANRSMAEERLKLTWHHQMEESRRAVATQLFEVSNIMKDYSAELYKSKLLSEEREEEIIHCLDKLHIRASQVTLFKRKGRGMELYVLAACKEGRSISLRSAAVALSKLLHTRMIPAIECGRMIQDGEAEYIFREDVGYTVLTGIARAVKDKEEVSGDSFSFLYPDNGDLVMLLSDGMGSGKEAEQDSEAVISLLEHLLEAGFHEETAVRLINSVLVLRSENHSFSTVDMSVINLYSGTCEFVKIGAATTFIKRDGWVETVASATLPVGMLQEVDYDTKLKKLYDGDYVIMMSDGVLDSLGEQAEATLAAWLCDLENQNPQGIASAVLKHALEKQEFTPADDMTVLVAGIWKKVNCWA